MHTTRLIPGARVLGRARSREQWLKMRTLGIGGSDAAAVLGESRFATPHDVWLKKLGLAKPEPSKPIMRLGNLLEDAILDRQFLGAALPGDQLGTLQSIEHPELVANVDGVLEDGTLVEIKTSSAAAWAWRKGVPDYYHAQVQHYLLVTGLARAVVVRAAVQVERDAVCLLIEEAGARPERVVERLCEITTYEVERDPEWMARYLPVAREFWRRVKAREWPREAATGGANALAEEVGF